MSDYDDRTPRTDSEAVANSALAAGRPVIPAAQLNPADQRTGLDWWYHTLGLIITQSTGYIVGVGGAAWLVMWAADWIARRLFPGDLGAQFIAFMLLSPLIIGAAGWLVIATALRVRKAFRPTLWWDGTWRDLRVKADLKFPKIADVKIPRSVVPGSLCVVETSCRVESGRWWPDRCGGILAWPGRAVGLRAG